MRPKLYRVTIFFGSDVLRLALEDYMLFGWNSCARCLARTLGSIEFFLTQVNTVWFEPHQKLQFWMGPKLYRVTIFFGSHVFRLATEDYMLFGLKSTLCRFQPHEKLLYDFGWGPNFIEFPSSLAQTFYDLQGKITCCSDGTLAQDAPPEH